MTEEEMNRIADLVVEKMAKRMMGTMPVQPVYPSPIYVPTTPAYPSPFNPWGVGVNDISQAEHISTTGVIS